MRLSGEVAVVTGAARGIGRSIAEAYIRLGARVAMVDVLEKTLLVAASALGARAFPICTDIAEAEEVERMVREVEAGLGPIAVLVNNAGTFSTIGPVWEADPDRWFRGVRTNLYGSFLVCRSVVGRMVPRGRGYVINMVSSGGVGDPHPYSTSYASSKTGLMRLTEGLAKEVEPFGIKVFALAPPAILTEMTRFIMDDPGGQRWRPGFREMMDERWHPPEIVAEWAVRLVSGRADALSGRYLLAASDFEETVAQAERILDEDLLTLRIRRAD